MAGFIEVTCDVLEEADALSVADDLATRATGEVYVVPGEGYRQFGVWRDWTKSDDDYGKRIYESRFECHRHYRLPRQPSHVIWGRRETP